MKKIFLSQIEDLAVDEIAGVITPEEKEYLYWAISVDPEAKDIWQEIQDKAPQLLADAEESFRNSRAPSHYRGRTQKTKQVFHEDTF